MPSIHKERQYSTAASASLRNEDCVRQYFVPLIVQQPVRSNMETNGYTGFFCCCCCAESWWVVAATSFTVSDIHSHTPTSSIGSMHMCA